MSWETHKEKLLCHMVLDDDIAPQLSCKAGPTFFRAFIVQNRETGIITAKMRWKYNNGKRSWIYLEVKPGVNPEQACESLRCSIEDILKKAALVLFHVDEKEMSDAIHCFYPPDDQGDPEKTLAWLQKRDLIEIIGVEPIEGDGIQ